MVRRLKSAKKERRTTTRYSTTLLLAAGLLAMLFYSLWTDVHVAKKYTYFPSLAYQDVVDGQQHQHNQSTSLANTKKDDGNTEPTTDAPNSTKDTPVAIETSSFQIQYTDYRTRFPVPEWLEEFLTTQPPQTHNESLLDPNQKFLVMTCHRYEKTKGEDCGGLADRLKTLPYFLWVAKNSGRKLLIKYTKPHPLEEFMVPPKDSLFDWQVPDGYFEKELEEYANRSQSKYQAMRRYAWNTTIDKQPWKDKRVVFANCNLAMGHMLTFIRENIGTSLDEIMPGLWRRMFYPSPAVENIISGVAEEYGLVAGNYAAAHLRLKWPLLPPKRIIWMSKQADKQGGGIAMQHNRTKWNVELLSHNAINCAMEAMPEARRVYFASDANEAVQYLLDESPWSDKYDFPNTTVTRDTVVIPKLLARPDYNTEPRHFDTAHYKGSHPSEFYATFVDMWIMSHAKCISHGTGGFPRLTAILAGNYNTCRIKSWMNKNGTQYCPEFLNKFGYDLKPRLVIPH